MDHGTITLKNSPTYDKRFKTDPSTERDAHTHESVQLWTIDYTQYKYI